MSYHLGMMFSTKDQDNDGSDKIDCATLLKAGWWFNECIDAEPGVRADLNGPYGECTDKEKMMRTKDSNCAKDIVWAPWLGELKTLKFTEMKIREIPYSPNSTTKA